MHQDSVVQSTGRDARVCRMNGLQAEPNLATHKAKAKRLAEMLQGAEQASQLGLASSGCKEASWRPMNCRRGTHATQFICILSKEGKAWENAWAGACWCMCLRRQQPGSCADLSAHV